MKESEGQSVLALNGGRTLKVLKKLLGGSREYIKQILGFVKRAVLVAETQEGKRLENLKAYLDCVSAVVEQMRANGASSEEIQNLLTELSVPAVRANLNALLLENSIANYERLKQRFVVHRYPRNSSNPQATEHG